MRGVDGRVDALLSSVATCDANPARIAALESFRSLVERRGATSSGKETGCRCKAGRLVRWASDRACRVASGCGRHWSKWKVLSALCALVALVVGLVVRHELHTLHGFARFWLHWENIDLHAEQCTLDMPSLIQDTFRPPVDCSMCVNVSQVDRVRNITPAEFEARYAYSGRPVVVEDGQRNWSARKIFSFAFFRSIYAKDSPALYNLERECQFFPYETAFRNLKEVLNMSRERAAEPWYIGWSNCDSAAADIIRKHYEKPYFLPETSEESKTDWIFMGTPGHGAHIHIDHVVNPSWQAQIRGRKRWSLEPPPECYFQCVPLETVVNEGEIIILDTNIWYHGTYILPEEISITIGSEYD